MKRKESESVISEDEKGRKRRKKNEKGKGRKKKRRIRRRKKIKSLVIKKSLRKEIKTLLRKIRRI